VHPPLSSALIGSSESSLLVTLGDRHHLDGSTVIGGTKIAQSSCGWLGQACEQSCHSDRVSKN